MLVVLQDRRNFSFGRTSRGNRSCVLAQKLWTILLVWNRMLSLIPQVLVTSESRVVAKDLNKELSSLGLLWNDVEFPDTEQLSYRLPACPVPQVVGLHSLAWSWQAFSLLWVLPSVSLRGKSVATPIFCCLKFAAYWFWRWRVVLGIHIKNLQFNKPGIISPLKSGQIVSLLSFQDSVGRRVGHSVASADYDSSTNHDLEDTNCS